MIQFFGSKATGRNADLRRHAATEAELRQCVIDAKDERTKRVYEHFLTKLLDSKAEVADSIGKK